MKLYYLLTIFGLTATLQAQPQNQGKTYSGNPNDSIRIMQLLDLAIDDYRQQHYDSVILQCEAILTLSNQVAFIRGEGEAYLLKGRALNRLGRKEKASEFYSKAINEFKTVNAHERLASTYNNLGILLKGMGKFREAIEAGEMALENVRLLGNSQLKIQILNNLGNSYQNIALFKKASNVYFESLNVLKKEQESLFKNRATAEVYINLGIAYFEQKLFEKSKETYLIAKVILEQQGLVPQLAALYNNLSEANVITGDYNIARIYLNAADSLYRALDDKVGLAICRNNFGKLKREQKKFQESISLHNLAIGQLGSLNATAYLASCYLDLGKTQTKAGRLKEAHISLLRGLQIALKAGQKVQELMLYQGLIELHKSREEMEETIMYYDLYAALSQELNDQQIGRHIGQLELEGLITKRDAALKTLESQTASLEFQISRRNLLLTLSVVVIFLISIVFTLAFTQSKLKARNKRILLEQKILRTQFNPHFIFNALGAIQHYMLDHEPQLAAGYLSKFSALMRSILESSREGYTTLSTELDNIRNYLDLQSLRFSDTLKYTIEIDPAINPELIELPALLIQPLLENSIEHGLLPNKGGKVFIKVNQVAKNILIEVEDNGVGLTKSTRVKTIKNKPSSLGNTIIKERLSLFSKHNKDTVTFNMVDRASLDKRFTGTKVSLTIPIKF